MNGVAKAGKKLSCQRRVQQTSVSDLLALRLVAKGDVANRLTLSLASPEEVFAKTVHQFLSFRMVRLSCLWELVSISLTD